VKEKRVIFAFPTTFQAGTHLQLKVRFAGELNDIKVGYYRISYEKDGKNQYYSLTQFEVRLFTPQQVYTELPRIRLLMLDVHFRAGMNRL